MIKIIKNDSGLTKNRSCRDIMRSSTFPNILFNSKCIDNTLVLWCWAWCATAA